MNYVFVHRSYTVHTEWPHYTVLECCDGDLSDISSYPQHLRQGEEHMTCLKHQCVKKLPWNSLANPNLSFHMQQGLMENLRTPLYERNQSRAAVSSAPESNNIKYKAVKMALNSQRNGQDLRRREGQNITMLNKEKYNCVIYKLSAHSYFA